jgi:hypothetical protein
VIHSGDHPDELWAGAFIILIDGATIYYTMWVPMQFTEHASLITPTIRFII